MRNVSLKLQKGVNKDVQKIIDAVFRIHNMFIRASNAMQHPVMSIATYAIYSIDVNAV